ncbi:MAG: hypothetical protein WAW06_03615 [bacterium]
MRLPDIAYRAAFAVAIAALAMTAGCGTTDDGGAGQGAGLAEYGGYTPTPEAPGFGDTGLVAAHPEDTPYDDELLGGPDVSNALRNGGARHYMLRLVWGNLDNPDTTVSVCPATDWSGSIKADGGVIIIRRLVRFEPGDSIVRPRKGAREIEWASHTGNHFDGILFQIVDVPDPRHRMVANSVTITTPLYTAEIPFDSLAAYDQTITFDGCNKIAVVAVEMERAKCPRGFLEGAWVSESDTSGWFKGAWVRQDGALDGYLRGRYTVEEGRRVLYGKWITTAGDFGGLMRGIWGPLLDDDEEEADEAGPDGYFEGHWVNEALTVAGDFRGHYCLPESPDTAGFFHGRWKQSCR